MRAEKLRSDALHTWLREVSEYGPRHEEAGLSARHLAMGLWREGGGADEAGLRVATQVVELGFHLWLYTEFIHGQIYDFYPTAFRGSITLLRSRPSPRRHRLVPLSAA